MRGTFCRRYFSVECTAMLDCDTPETPADGKLRRIAYHEAGHAVAAIVFGHQFDEVLIDPEEPTAGREGKGSGHIANWTDGVLDRDVTMPVAENRALFAFAGDAADMYLIGGRPPGETFDHGGDYWCALSGTERVFPENRERHSFLDRMEDRAREFVREPLRWRQIQALAEALLVRHRLSGTEAAELVASVAEDG
jgi:hypothetical protein